MDINIDVQFHIMFGENASSSKTIKEIRENVLNLILMATMNDEWMKNALSCLLYVSESVIKTSTSMIESILFKVMNLTILQNRSKNYNFTFGFAANMTCLLINKTLLRLQQM